MHYLIDGYNLLHALGIRIAAAGLDAARARLLNLLHEAHAEEAGSVTVVFDARRSPRGAPAERDYHGLHIVFAVEEGEADELIERLVRAAPVPRKLTVVSDDHRIQEAGRRRHCTVLGCAAYLDHLSDRRRVPPETSSQPEKPFPAPADLEHWLR